MKSIVWSVVMQHHIDHGPSPVDQHRCCGIPVDRVNGPILGML